MEEQMFIKNRGAVVITGASSGIGQACALKLDTEGYQIFATVRKEKDAESLKNAASNSFKTIFMDVTDNASIIAAADTVAQRFGKSGLAGLVNNAGVYIPGPMELIPESDLRR